MGLIGVAALEFAKTPTGFIPEQAQGYLINVIQLPPGSTLDHTEKVVQCGIDVILGTKGVEHVAPFAGPQCYNLHGERRMRQRSSPACPHSTITTFRA
jgi:multidrug efflux pump subunit AcrB